MTDDNLPDDVDSTEDTNEEVLEDATDEIKSEEPQDAPAISSNRIPRGNREDESALNDEGLQDAVREKFTSLRVLLLSTGAIIFVSLLAGWIINKQDAPGAVDADWATLNGKILELRESANQNVFDANRYASYTEELTNADARAWFNLEIASALIAISIQPDNVDQLPPQMRQQQPASVLAGDQVAIENRVTNLETAYKHLQNALERFSTSEAQTHALGTLGHYRAEYSAAYVSEILLLLGGYEDFTQQREKVLGHLNGAKAALPTIPGKITNSTDRDIKALRDQIESRQALFEQMSESQITDITDVTETVDNAAIYSWIGKYITTKNTPVPKEEPDNSQDPMTPMGDTQIRNTGDDGDFQIEGDSSEAADDPSTGDSTKGEAEADK